jgi:predicted DNA-binding transcriptional regulator YafY
MSVWDGKVVEFTYENHRGVTEIRRIVPMYIWFGETPYHKRKQWFVHGWCFERQAARDFAWSEIQGWAEAEDQSLPWRDRMGSMVVLLFRRRTSRTSRRARTRE